MKIIYNLQTMFQSSSVNAQDLLLSKTVYDLMRGAERNEDNSKELKNVFKAIKNM